MSEESVKVAVRVRPFNSREKQRNAKCIISMSDKSTIIRNPKDESDSRTFTFDYSYWSHDGADESEDGYLIPQPGSKYVGQREVFQDIGVGLLDNAWNGYNSTLFAYGQTGSGKSWSVVGYGTNKGIVPRFCEEIFTEIDKKQMEGCKTEYEVVFSMLEIYNESVYDLLDSDNSKALQVRQHPKKGFYAVGLISVPVKDYADIERRIEQGTQKRTIASTNMNENSSRAHTIVGVSFIQKMKNAAGEETAKSSVVNLVDLAGSERADSTGATGRRLQEGAAINQSLSNLGNCIAALAKCAEGKQVRVPFRDSTLTKLLKNALGGNSKTIMIAALSPADVNYEETLSTLRYADRAKQIKTKATVNEDPMEKLIKELQEENMKLKEMLANGRMSALTAAQDEDEAGENQGLSEEEIKAKLAEEFAARMAENERMLKEMERKWEEKLADAEKVNKEKDDMQRLMNEQRKVVPHIYNLSPDPMLSGIFLHLIKKDVNTIGKNDADEKPDIPLMGINVLKGHGMIKKKDGGFEICKTEDDARIIVNGISIDESVDLHHSDRILIGTSHLYVFHDPAEMNTLKENGAIPSVPTYEQALEEIAQNSGVSGDEDSSVSQEVTDFLPHLDEANGISEELDKKVQFEPIVLTKDVKELVGGEDDIICKITQLQTGYVWHWKKEKLFARKFAMEEMYRKFQNGEKWELPPEEDPFFEPWFTECLIGGTKISLEPLAHLTSVSSVWPLIDCRGLKVGELDVSVYPCNENGDELGKDGSEPFIDNPNVLLGERLNFKVMIKKGTWPKRYTDVFCKYSIFSDNVTTDVLKVAGENDFKHVKLITVENCDETVIDFLKTKALLIKVRGCQKANLSKPINNAAKQGKTTRQIRKIEALAGKRVSGKPRYDAKTFQTIAEYLLMRKRREILEAKLLKIKTLCDNAESKGETTISVAETRQHLGYLDLVGWPLKGKTFLKARRKSVAESVKSVGSSASNKASTTCVIS